MSIDELTCDVNARQLNGNVLMLFANKQYTCALWFVEDSCF